MCEDCSGPAISRRALVSTTLAGSVGGLAVGQGPASGATRVVERICRAAWGAQPVSGVFTPHVIKRLTVHHSAVALPSNRKAPQHLRAYQQDHQSEGSPDIAYHVAVDRRGNVYQLRPPWAVGDTRTSYDPTGHFLVLCVGNLQTQTLPATQLDATINVLAWASARFGVVPRTITGHRDHAATSCPGNALYRYIADGTIRRRVARRVGNVRMVDLCGRAGRRRVTQIENGAR